jgi:hypothetical protein
MIKTGVFLIKKHMLAIVLASAFFAVDMTAYMERPEINVREGGSQTGGLHTSGAGENKGRPRLSASRVPEDCDDGLRGIRHNQRCGNAENVPARRPGNGTGITGQASGKTRSSCWPVFKLSLRPDGLQTARESVISFLHDKDGMK